MKNIKKVLNNKPFCNELHFFLFGLILFSLAINHYILLLPFIAYMIFIFKKSKLLLPISIIILLFFTIYIIKTKSLDLKEPEIITKEFIVKEVKPNYIIIKEEDNWVIYIKNHEFFPGDIVKMTIYVDIFDSKSYEWDFDSKHYYSSINVKGVGTILDYEIVGSRYTINRLRYNIIEYYQDRLKPKSFNYVNAVVFGNNNLDDNIKEAYSDLFISHILTISGMHIMLIYEFIKLIMNKIFKIEGSIFSTFIIFLYVGFIGFKVSSLRAFLVLLVGLSNRKGYLKYTKLDVYSIVFIFMLLINPYWIYNVGFILSFIVSFILIFLNEITSNYSKLVKLFLNTFICILVTLPIVINMNFSLNLIGLIVSFLIALFLPKILIGVSFISLIIPNIVFEYFFIGLDNILLFLSIDIFKIKMIYMNIYMIIGYYLLLVLLIISFIKNKKVFNYLIYLTLYLICLNNINRLNPNYKITFINVGQGDSCLISSNYGRHNILIDSFNNIDYLEGLGNINIDYVFLSHLDFDHISSVDTVLEQYDVKNIYYSVNSDNNKIPDCFSNKWIKLKANDILNIDDISIKVLGVNKYKEENDNSLILSINIFDYSLLFMGDASTQVEEDLIEIYGKELKSDILKVGHHGSNTSTSDLFLGYVRPRYSIISVGKNNKYGLPNGEIVDKLNKISECYITSINGNITFIINKKNYRLKTFKR